MKTFVQKTWMPLSLLAVCLALFSFSFRWGGEGFEIYLNNKLVMQQFGSQMASVRSLQLDQRFANEELTVKYYHCGQAGKNRHITIKDAQNRILKDWNFADGNKAGMNCPINEILALQKRESSNSMGLYYSSTELPKGRLLFTILSANANQTKP